MHDSVGFILIIAALAVGFFLGRNTTPQKRRSHPTDYPLNYYKGLSYLFNEQPDAAIDAFINALDVNDDTLEAHLALGNMLRRRGEVTKAIKIHQNLLASTGLTQNQLEEAQLALSRDYIRSGLLDRAELLLLELVERASEYKAAALLHLMEIYRDENEWDKAIDMAAELNHKKYADKHDLPLNEIQAHFSCEQAMLDMATNDTKAVRLHLTDALKFDPHSVRASLLLATIEHADSNYVEVLEHLHKIPQQNPDFIIEGLELLCDAYEQLGQQDKLVDYLFSLLTEHSSNTLIITIADKLFAYQDTFKAEDFIAQQLKDKPSIRTLSRLVEFHLPHSEGKAKENLGLLKQLVDKVIAEKPSYCCNKCGFTGNSLYWLCPGCKHWGRVRPIKGVAGE